MRKSVVRRFMVRFDRLDTRDMRVEFARAIAGPDVSGCGYGC
jgi:hypothetical protein